MSPSVFSGLAQRYTMREWAFVCFARTPEPGRVEVVTSGSLQVPPRRPPDFTAPLEPLELADSAPVDEVGRMRLRAPRPSHVSHRPLSECVDSNCMAAWLSRLFGRLALERERPEVPTYRRPTLTREDIEARHPGSGRLVPSPAAREDGE